MIRVPKLIVEEVLISSISFVERCIIADYSRCCDLLFEVEWVWMLVGYRLVIGCQLSSVWWCFMFCVQCGG